MGLTAEEVKYVEEGCEFMFSEKLTYCLGQLETVGKKANCMVECGITELWR